MACGGARKTMEGTVNNEQAKASRTVSQFKFPPVSRMMSLTKPAAPPSPIAPKYLHH
jgi:hypothetical protein